MSHIFTIRNAAVQLRLSERQVRRLIKSGKLVASYHMIPIQTVMLVVTAESLVKLIEERSDSNRLKHRRSN